MKGAVEYFGLLDDFALRNHIVGSCSDNLGDLNRLLLKQAFIGQPLVINDGYFIMHPASRMAITQPENSPFCRLTESSFITILSRNSGGLEKLAEDMSETDITTGKDLAKSNFYLNQFKPRLEEWAPTLRSQGCNAFQGWPKFNMDECFIRTLKMGFDNYITCQSQEKADLALNYWKEFNAGTKRRRTEWEDLAKQFMSEGEIEKDLFLELMSIGNQAYQYSWASALTKSNKDKNIKALTNGSGFFLDLHDTDNRYIDHALAKVELVVPILDDEFIKKQVNGRWGLIADMLQDGHEVNIAKAEFMQRLSEYPLGDCSPSDISYAAGKYSEVLSKHFKSDSKLAPLTWDFFSLLGGAAAGIVGGAAVGFGIGALGLAAAHKWPGPQIFDWMSTPSSSDWIGGLKTTYVNSSTTSLSIDSKKADLHLDGVQEFSV